MLKLVLQDFFLHVFDVFLLFLLNRVWGKNDSLVRFGGQAMRSQKTKTIARRRKAFDKICSSSWWGEPAGAVFKVSNGMEKKKKKKKKKDLLNIQLQKSYHINIFSLFSKELF